jgi:hypothetical protein
MKIVDLKVISFRVPRRPYRSGQFLPETTVVQTLTKIVTDAGAAGYYLGGHGHGDQDGLHPDEIAALTGRFREMLIGQDPFDRERFWHWMWVANLPENLISVVDMALWDLQGRLFGVPVHKLLGGCRDRVKAYASTFPNMGQPEVYAAHARACQAQGYRHYKIHPYYFWDPLTGQPDPGRPSHIEQDIEACRAVRAAVGPEMALSFDPWGTYRTYEDAVRVGRELAQAGFPAVDLQQLPDRGRPARADRQILPGQRPAQRQPGRQRGSRHLLVTYYYHDHTSARRWAAVAGRARVTGRMAPRAAGASARRTSSRGSAAKPAWGCTSTMRDGMIRAGDVYLIGYHRIEVGYFVPQGLSAVAGVKRGHPSIARDGPQDTA